MPAQHTHAIGEVSGLPAALDGKATTTSVGSLNGRVTNLEGATSTLYPTAASDTLRYGDASAIRLPVGRKSRQRVHDRGCHPVTQDVHGDRLLN